MNLPGDIDGIRSIQEVSMPSVFPVLDPLDGS